MTDPREEIKSADEAREKCHILKIYCPHLDDQMRPEPELVNMRCPSGFDGQCGRCERFVGYIPGDEGAIFAHETYEGWCLKDFIQEIKGE